MTQEFSPARGRQLPDSDDIKLDSLSFPFSQRALCPWAKAMILAVGISSAGLAVPSPAGASSGGSSGSSPTSVVIPKRHVNVAAMLATALAAREIWGDASLDIKVVKVMHMGGRISGEVSPDAVNLSLDQFGLDERFIAQTSSSERVAGKVARGADLDQAIEEISPGIWKIRRPLNPDAELELNVGQGRINGLVRQNAGLDWTVTGQYTPAGQIEMRIQIPVNFDVLLSGTCTPR